MRKTVFIPLLGIALFFGACSKQSAEKAQQVTVYVSEDQVFSEPILKDFEKETGIHVNAVYDTEESKGTGVMNRLIAEKHNPQADIYWANEPIRAEVLKHKGILAPYHSPSAEGIAEKFHEKEFYWTGFSARVRLFVVNNKAAQKPTSVFDYADPAFKGKGVIANPLFGTTTSHIAALFTVLGDDKAKTFMKQLKANDIAISTSNGESADFVASGSYNFALVDSDDAMSRLAQHAPISFVYPDQGRDQIGAFVVPNTVMLIRGAPHPQTAKKLIDYLLSKKVEEKLAFAECAQIPLHEGVPMPKGLKPIEKIKTMRVDYGKVAEKLVEIQPWLKQWLNRN